MMAPFLIIFSFLGSLIIAAFLTFIVRRVALKFHIVDDPSLNPERKIHFHPTPLLGGFAIFGAVSAMMMIFGYGFDALFNGYLLPKHVFGIIGGGLLIMTGGYYDDRFGEGFRKQILWALIASFVIVASGIGIESVSNPFGKPFDLSQFSFTLFQVRDIPYRVILFSDVFTVIWLMGMMLTTKWLDGLDGLVSGITVIGSFFLFVLSMTKDVAQPETALLALMIGGASAGFFLWNFYPAKIFLGQGGSVLCGFLLGVLAIISGGKVATMLLIMGIPILDVLWVMGRRAIFEKRKITDPDRKHLHFRLLEAGLSQRQAVFFLFIVTMLFGLAGILFQRQEKFFALISLFVFMLILASILFVRYHKHHGENFSSMEKS